MSSLGDPVELAGRSAPSRVMFGPHETNLAERRAMSAAHAAYYARRAAGGAGVIVTEAASVHDSDWPYELAPLAADCGSGWAATVEACRPHGALVLAALGHSGSQGSSAFHQRALWAPSRVPDVASREMPMEMEQPEITALVEGFASATTLAVRSDVDGVEVDAGQYALLRQFLSGLTNQRGDAYGERTALLHEVLTAVREALGDRILGLRLSCDELAPWAGITPEQAQEIVTAVAPSVDYLVVVRGSAMGTAATKPDAHTEPGFNIELCRTVRGCAEGVPVVLQGSVIDPGQAQWALDDGVADLVEMTRAQIADPDLVDKHRDGTPVRPCVLTNQRCRVRDNRNPVITCIGEPRSGHEVTDPPVEPAGDTREFTVAGGGPAGMEAARVLALRGNRVRLSERDSELGGMLRWVATLPGRERLGDLVRWLAGELERLGVQVDLDTVCETADVIATGSVPGPRGYTVRDGATVLEVADLLRAAPELTGPVVVHDPVGDATGVATAELLAGRGNPTTILTQDQIPGTQLAITGDLADANARLQRAGVTIARSAVLREVRPGTVMVTDVFTGEQREYPCDTLVHCGHRVPDAGSVPPNAVPAGDRVAPRTVHEAILEGRRAALALTARIPQGVS